MNFSATTIIDDDSLIESLLNELSNSGSSDLSKVRYGCNGTIKKDSKEYKHWRDRNNYFIEVIKLATNSTMSLFRS